jgi:PKHD-type hydroxylase
MTEAVGDRLEPAAATAYAAEEPPVPDWALDRLRLFPAVVSAEACEQIIARCKALEMDRGPLHNNTTGDRFYDAHFRMTSVGWIKDRDWIHDLMHGYAREANEDWGFVLDDADQLQFAVYRKNDFFEFHKDLLRVRRGTIRKVSAVLQLDPPQNYRGGALEFLDEDFGPFRLDAFAAQGSVAVFSSLLKHRVTPIKGGERRSLTVWFKGPPFR